MDSNNEQTAVQSEQQTESGDITIDLGRIFRALLHYIWVIILATILGAVIMFGYTKLFVTELYTTSATIYVSNTNSDTITSSDSNVANVVSALITDYNTLENAKDYANETYSATTGKTYTHGQFSGSVSTSVGSSGLLTLSVTYSDPSDAAVIANSILAVLEDRASEIYKGDIYVKAYSEARVPSSPSSPNTTRNVLIGALAGFALSCVIIVLIELLNNKIYNNEYLITTYNIPVLTEIPDFSDKKAGKKGYANKYGYGYGYGENS